MSQLDWRKPLALAGALFVLGAFAYWLEYSHKPKIEEKEESQKKLVELKGVVISSFKVSDGSRTFAFKCLDVAAKLCKFDDKSKWETTEPLKVRADDANINSFLSTVNTTSSSDTINLAEETPEKRNSLLKEYGLSADFRNDPNAKRVEFIDDKNQKTVVYLGETHPVGDSVFAMVARTEGSTLKANESKIYLVPVFFKTNLERDLTYWRDKKILALNAHEVSRFQLDVPKGKIAGEKKSGKWSLSRLGKAENIPGDDENIDSLLGALSFVNAKSFIAENKNDENAKSKLSGAKNVATITVEVPKHEIVLKLFEKKDAKGASRTFATVADLDPVYEIENSLKDRLNKSLDDLRMKKLLTAMERYNTKRIEFSGKPVGEKPLILAEVGDAWQREPDNARADKDKILALLDKLSGNQVREFIVGKHIPGGQDEGLTIILGTGGKKFLFWKNKAKLYARDLDGSKQEAFVMDSSVSDALPWSREFLMKTPQSSPSEKSSKR